MTMPNATEPDDRHHDPELARLDQELELLLDEAVQTDGEPTLPPGFELRVTADRPFAPWEVRQVRFWRVATASVGGLLGASTFLAIAPLWKLGPGTAVSLWTGVLASAAARPVAALLDGLPLLRAGASKAAIEAGPVLAGGLLLGGIVAAGTLAAILAPAFGRRGAGRATGR